MCNLRATPQMDPLKPIKDKSHRRKHLCIVLVCVTVRSNVKFLKSFSRT